MSLTVSIIVPCYNEADKIARCLEALNRQSVKPLEIIIVDNNCTDNTAKIANRFTEVRIISEKRQGVIAARNAGMMAAKGGILARIDADTIVAKHWIASIQTTFEKQQIQAVTGTGYFYDAPCKRFVRAYRNFFAVWLNRVVLGHHMLWGSNMAVRRQAWQAISNELCSQPDLMEDLDMAIHIYENFGKRAIAYQPKLRADISARRAMVSLKHNWLYLKMWPWTLSLHGRQRRIILWPTIAILLVTMAIGNKVGRFYNETESRMIFSLKQWRSNPLYTRPNP